MSISNPGEFTVDVVSWQQAETALSAIRRRVFIQEQMVPETLEWDGLDVGARHLLATSDTGQAVGCARLLTGGRLGRMAVLPSWRRRGVGRALLEAAVNEYRRQGCVQVTLAAQAHAIDFYRKFGFAVCSGVYMDAGIPHRDMALTL
jgi:predicted GNAT family N-acyltransferase